MVKLARSLSKQTHLTIHVSAKAISHTCEYLPSLISFCLLRNQSGILYWRGFCIIVITRSTCQYKTKIWVNIDGLVCSMRSKFNIMYLNYCIVNFVFYCKYNFRSMKYHITSSSVSSPARLFISTSAFLHTRLAYLRPTPYNKHKLFHLL